MSWLDLNLNLNRIVVLIIDAKRVSLSRQLWVNKDRNGLYKDKPRSNSMN
jgi:hypothetical protein